MVVYFYLSSEKFDMRKGVVICSAMIVVDVRCRLCL